MRYIMAFCKYSTEYVASSKTEIDNIFINDYLPHVEGDFVKVYIYGLYMCNNPNAFDNSLEAFCKHLNMSEEDIIGAFNYWQEEGLVKVLSTCPIEVRYIPLKNVLTSNKLYKPEKYELFNKQAQEIFEGKRDISKTEYNEYYDFLERYHMEQEALIMIMKYCVETKSRAIGYHYILTVARNWANEGITSAEQVAEQISSFENNGDELALLFATTGVKRKPSLEDRSLISKWLNDYGFNFDVVLNIAKKFNKQNKFTMEKLDEVLSRYYGMQKMSIQEIDEFEKQRESIYQLAKEINKTLGLYYQSLDSEIENYIMPWLDLGFDQNVLLELAYNCFKTSVRTLEGMDKRVRKFYKLGIVTLDALNTHMNNLLAQDERISLILKDLGINRLVNYKDRENYKTWTENWKFNDEMLNYGVMISSKKENPLQYLSRVLSDWHAKGISTAEEAKKTTPISDTFAKPKQNFTGRSYTREQMNSLFQSIDDIEI